jgi:hypothetical protein
MSRLPSLTPSSARQLIRRLPLMMSLLLRRDLHHVDIVCLNCPQGNLPG